MRILLVVDYKDTPNPVVDLNWTAVPSMGDDVMYCGELLEVISVEWHVCYDWEVPPADLATWIPYARVTIGHVTRAEP